MAFIALVVMPSIRGSTAPDDRLAAFRRIEGRFAPQARGWVDLQTVGTRPLPIEFAIAARIDPALVGNGVTTAHQSMFTVRR